jgi:amidophosphoribosyltransferase
MSDLYEECGIAAAYHLPGAPLSPLCPFGRADATSQLLPRMMLDIQNRGQLAAGVTSFHPSRDHILLTHRDLGTVNEAFRMSHRGKYESLMERLNGSAAIGHVRYATCGKDDVSYAQPFERHHLQKRKWFSVAFNGQLANYQHLRKELLADGDHHLARDSDTEIIVHEISRQLSSDINMSLPGAMERLCHRFDGAYSLLLLNACGDLVAVRDPLGIKPLCYAFDGSLFLAASESVAIVNLGVPPEKIFPVPPGYCVGIVDGEFFKQSFVEAPNTAHCFFEWVYFANVASSLDGRSVYLARKALGEELAELELSRAAVTLDDNTIVVPVPDTSKAAADAMGYRLGIPVREGLIRNRYSGRTFIQGPDSRHSAVSNKYTPLREVMQGKRVLLVEDSIVRSTTMRVLLRRIREEGGAAEVHVRVACPPILAPCFYGIDMSTIGELFAPRYADGGEVSSDGERRMAAELGADSLMYLPVTAVARAIDKSQANLCQACITGRYPTAAGQQLYEIALNLAAAGIGKADGRTYEVAAREA